MYMSAALIIGAVVCAYAALWVRGRRSRALLKGLPTTFNLPFIGGFHKVLGGNESKIMRFIKEITAICEETNLPYVLWAGPYPIIVIHNEEDLKEVMNRCLEKPYYYRFLRDWLGDGIFIASGSIWKQHIKKLSSTFTTQIVGGYQDLFNAQAQLMVKELKGEIGKPPFDIMEKYLINITFETVCQSAFGQSGGSLGVPMGAYVAARQRILRCVMQRGTNILLHPEPLFRLSCSYHDMRDAIDSVHKLSDKVVNNIIKKREEIKTTEIIPERKEPYEVKFKSFLELLMDVRESDDFLTPQQMRAEVDTFLFAGQETTATAAAFALILLGSHPHVQNKLYAELREIFGDSKRPVQKEDLKRMRYCEAVTYETLRLYPPAPLLFRYADKDLQLKSCTVPTGSICALNIWGAGRSGRAWGPDAARFRPERWLEADSHHLSSVFMAFSYGRRSCIGRRYAIAFVKTILAHCIRDLKVFSDSDKLQLKMELVLSTTSGYHVAVQAR